MVRALIRLWRVQRILRKSGVEQSERTRVSEGKICDNEVKQITCPRDSKIQDKSRRRHHKKERSTPLFFVLYATKILSSGKYAQPTYSFLL